MEICALIFADFLARKTLRIFVASVKILFCIGWYLTKYWFYEEGTLTSNFSSLS